VKAKRFLLKPAHVALLRTAYVSWDDYEFGAPQIDPKRPYRNSHVVRDIFETLFPNEPWNEDYGLPANMTAGQWEDAILELEQLHKETQTALQVILASGSFEPGEYECDWPHTNRWRPV
jgi:hypothetical protein